MTDFNFNNAGPQKSFEVIPAGTICELQMEIRPGGGGDDGWLKRASTEKGESQGIDCVFTVTSPEQYARRKVFQTFTMEGTAATHADSGEISRKTLCAILESARGIRPDDKSEAADLGRRANDWSDFQNLRFVARLGVKPAQGQYAAKNTLLEVVTPDRKAWTQPQQLPPDPTATKSPAGNGAAPGSTTSAAAAAAPTNASISRPKWAAD